MKIDWLKYYDKKHVLAWFISEAMGNAGMENFNDIDSSNLDIELKINGIEVSIIEVMESLESQLKDIKNNGIKQGKEDAIGIITENIEKLFYMIDTEND